MTEIDPHEVTLALKVALEAAKDHRGCAPETCGGSRLDPCMLSYALDDLREYQERRGYLEPEQGWAPATLVQCLAGDRIRIGTDETDVIRTDGGRVWHADNADPYRPKPWKHIELRMELAANPGFQEYPPNTPCEIFADSERAASLALQQAFPGSAVTSSNQPLV